MAPARDDDGRPHVDADRAETLRIDVEVMVQIAEDRGKASGENLRLNARIRAQEQGSPVLVEPCSLFEMTPRSVVEQIEVQPKRRLGGWLEVERVEPERLARDQPESTDEGLGFDRGDAHGVLASSDTGRWLEDAGGMLEAPR
jgi:hypothetical protein